MKRWVCFLLSAALLLLAAGCAREAQEKAGSYDLYFLETEPEMGGGALQAEKAYLPELPLKVDAACCAGVTPESHENALAAMAMCQIEILR